MQEDIHGLTDEDVEEFRQLWKEEFKEELTMDQARSEARQFMQLYLLLAGFPAD